MWESVRSLVGESALALKVHIFDFDHASYTFFAFVLRNGTPEAFSRSLKMSSGAHVSWYMKNKKFMQEAEIWDQLEKATICLYDGTKRSPWRATPVPENEWYREIFANITWIHENRFDADVRERFLAARAIWLDSRRDARMLLLMLRDFRAGGPGFPASSGNHNTILQTIR